jgi:hypothetical protein
MRSQPRARFAHAIACAAFLGVVPAAHAAWPHDPAIGLPVCTLNQDQVAFAAVSDGAGGEIVFWADARNLVNFDIYAQRISPSGTLMWTSTGVAVCTATGNQWDLRAISDGAGGAIAAWQDARAGATYDLYAQRIDGTGAVKWTANGVAVCTAANDQENLRLVSDGASGTIIAWADKRNPTEDIYAQRLNSLGAPQWAANGVAVCTAVGEQVDVASVATSGGGAILAWADSRLGPGLGDIYTQRLTSIGTAAWAANGTVICNAVNSQSHPAVVADLSGGALIFWGDNRTGSGDEVYGQHITSAATALWTANGLNFTPGISTQFPSAIADLSGGAIVVWTDWRNSPDPDIFAQRVSGAGVAQWTASGLAVCSTAGAQQYPVLNPDGNGGAVFAWTDQRNGANNEDVYAQHATPTGALWATNGVAITTAPQLQSVALLASDGAGGAIVTWSDVRNGVNDDVYAQRIERFGKLGNPEPTIVKVRDVPNDQGGQVTLTWDASYLDVVPSNPISTYWIWRQVPAAPGAASARPAGPDAANARPDAAGATSMRPSERRLRTTTVDGVMYAWEFVGSQSSHGFPSYSYSTVTLSDSVAGSNPYTRFMVEAESGSLYWSSAADSGYSVDNLGPATPAPFTAAYLAGATHLHWGANSEADLAGYRLYRGNSAGFIPGPGNLIAAEPDTGFDDVGAAGSYYKLSAVDIHDNESPFALLGPGSTTDVGGAPLSHALAFAAPRPNPARARTVLSFALPVGGAATLAVYDMVGRRVRTVSSGRMEAGEHSLAFDLRDDDGRQIPSGLYFVRLEAAGRALVRRLAILK